MTSDKKIANWIMDALLKMEVYTIICSPGSRNAPLVIAATARPEFEVLTVLDERSAAFQALGMALVQNRPVVVCCTSGSAIANYYPAVLEAFHSKVPLIVLSADRPEDRIMKGEGQTCVQQEFFTPHIGHCQHYNEEVSQKSFLTSLSDIHSALQDKLPVHINVAFNEPLYGLMYSSPAIDIELESRSMDYANDLSRGMSLLSNAKQVAMIIGQLAPNQSLQLREQLNRADHDHLYFADATSGLLDHPKVTSLATIVNYQPDAVLSFGGQWIDKKPKYHLRSLGIKTHVHVDPYQCWDVVDAGELVHVKAEADCIVATQLSKLSLVQPAQANATTTDLPWSDALVAQTVFNQLSPHDCLHLANSTAVRYFEWFPVHAKVYSNRGVAGIDGSLSTAVGAALADPGATHYCLIGDQSFLYDNNALHRNSIPKNLVICVLNNSVGGIFEWLPGVIEAPAKAKEVFLNSMSTDISGICQAHGLKYKRAEGISALEEALKMGSSGALVIDCKTSDSENATIANSLKELPFLGE